MADQNLSELLTEFQNLAESEHHGYIDSIVSRPENATTIFAALTFFEEKSKPHELLEPLCDLLFTIYRMGKNGEKGYRKFTIQFIPNLVYLYLQNYSEKHEFSCLETLLISIHNIEQSDAEHSRKSFKVPSIGTSSIYHDANLISESRIFAMPDTCMERGNGNNSATCGSPHVPLSHINAQNRNKVVSHLFSVFSYMLGTLTKECLEWSCRVSSRMIIRGFEQDGRHNGARTHYRVPSYGSESTASRLSSKPPVNRIYLPSSVYLDLLNLSYFAIANSYGVASGVKLAKDIEFRAKYECAASVILVSRAVAQLAATSSGNIAETPQLATPSVLTKNMITNASFRTKKLEGDIPRVENDEESHAQAEKMGMIVEEAEAEVERINKLNMKDGQDNFDGVDKVNIAEKLKDKMENVRDKVRIPIRKKDKDKEKDKEKEKEKERGTSESSDKDNNEVVVVKVKPDKKEKKNKDKKGDKNQVIDNDMSSEDFIRMVNLSGPGADTMTLHSPESGNTSIF